MTTDDPRLNILILEDVPADAELIQWTLRKQGIDFAARVVATRDAFLDALETCEPDVVLSDYSLPGFTGRAALQFVKQRHPDLPVIIVTGALDDSRAIELIKEGAAFYVLKSNLIRLPSVVEQVVLAAREHTALKDVQTKLGRSELHYRRLFESAQDGILVLEAATGKVLDVNPYMVELFGYTPDEYRGRQLWQLGPFKDVARSRATIAELRQIGHVHYEDLPLETNRGHEKVVEVIANTYKVNGGLIFQCNIRDITERRAMETELRRSELRYRRLFEAARDGILILDGDTGQVVDVNPYMVQLLGYTPAEYSGRQLWQLGPFKDVALSRTAFAALRRTGYARYDDLPLEASDGHEVNVEFVSNTYLSNGQRVIQCNIRDITERTATRKKLAAQHADLEEAIANRTTALAETNAQLKQVNEELQSFTYSVSHDLRAPLRAITGFTRILIEGYDQKLDKEAHRLLAVVSDNAVRMDQLINDILEFSRVGRVDTVLAPVDMTAIVRAVLAEELAPIIAVGREIKVGELPQAQGDASLLRRVWVNLLDNAIKFTSLKPDARIEVGARDGPAETTYYVRDTGAGFDKAVADKLFNAFQRLHGNEFPGTGIGLAIVKRIVARHSGRVWAESKLGEGATFYFSLPNAGQSQTLRTGIPERLIA